MRGHTGESQLESITAVGIDFSQLGLPEAEQVSATTKLEKSQKKLIPHPGVCPASL